MRRIPNNVILGWPKPNYVNPENKHQAVIIITSVVAPLCVIVFVARCSSRIFLLRAFGADDWMIVPAFITGIAYLICVLEGLSFGWYQHIWDNTLEDIIESRKLVLALSLTALLNAGFTKLSVLLLYLRIFPSSSKFRASVFVLLALTVGWMIAMGVTNFLLCMPLHAYWDVLFQGKQICLEDVPFYVSFSATDLCLDLLIYVFPLPAVAKMNLAEKEKWAVAGIFGIGLLTMAAAAVRVPLLLRATSSYDLTWEIFGVAIWTEVEVLVGLFCSSAPALKPLIQCFLPNAIRSRQVTEINNLRTSRTVSKHFESPNTSDAEMLNNKDLERCHLPVELRSITPAGFENLNAFDFNFDTGESLPNSPVHDPESLQLDYGFIRRTDSWSMCLNNSESQSKLTIMLEKEQSGSEAFENDDSSTTFPAEVYRSVSITRPKRQ